MIFYKTNLTNCLSSISNCQTQQHANGYICRVGQKPYIFNTPGESKE